MGKTDRKTQKCKSHIDQAVKKGGKEAAEKGNLSDQACAKERQTLDGNYWEVVCLPLRNTASTGQVSQQGILSFGKFILLGKLKGGPQ